MRLQILLVAALLLPALAAAEDAATDEFEGSLGASWDVVREVRRDWNLNVCGGPEDLGGCYLTIGVKPGSLVGPANDASNVFLEPAPAGDFRVTTLLAFPRPTHDDQHAGLLLYADDDDFFMLGVGAEGGAPVAETITEVGGIGNVETLPVDWSPLWLRYERFGTALTAYASADGYLWREVGTATLPTTTGLRVGLTASGPVGRDEVLDASFGFFRVESPPVGETRTEPPEFRLVARPFAGPPPLDVAFEATSSWAYPGLTWTLQFGDRTPPAEGAGFPLNATHTYARLGDFAPRLIVRNAVGLVGTVNASVQVAEGPVRMPEEVPEPDPADEGSDPGTVPAATEGAPDGPVVRVTDEDGDEVTSAQGAVRIVVEGAGSDLAIFAVDENERAVLLANGDSATWSTTDEDNGWYTIEARRGGVAVASARVLVENPRATPQAAAAAVVAGAAVTSVMSLGVSGLGGRGFDWLGFLGDSAENVAEDVSRKKTADLAALDRRRRVRSLLALGVAMLVNALAFSYAEVEPWDKVLFVAALPVVAGASVAYAVMRFGGEYALAHTTEARTRFRLWVPGLLALLVSAIAFRSPFGYPGYLRKEEPTRRDPVARRRASGLRSLASLGVFLTVPLAFVMIAPWRFDVAEFGIAMALAAFASGAMPVRPLPGGNVWAWNKPVAVAVLAAGVAVYFAYQVAVLPLGGLAILSFLALAWVIAAPFLIRRVTSDGDEIEVNDDG